MELLPLTAAGLGTAFRTGLVAFAGVGGLDRLAMSGAETMSDEGAEAVTGVPSLWVPSLTGLMPTAASRDGSGDGSDVTSSFVGTVIKELRLSGGAVPLIWPCRDAAQLDLLRPVRIHAGYRSKSAMKKASVVNHDKLSTIGVYKVA